ncbi:hypothetical protein [Alteromonas gracilis]|uniref:hypothetical protein n=1 Tax=Alteromonas gracilis TaxID=1479524 RepID=UPI0030CE4233
MNDSLKINGENLFSYKDAVKAGVIEHGIRRICELLYFMDALPLSSCEGHLRKPGSKDYVGNPFVMFHSSVETAKSINDAVVKKGKIDWMLRGRFHDSLDILVWTLRPAHSHCHSAHYSSEQLDNELKAVEVALEGCLTNVPGKCDITDEKVTISP